MTTVLLTCHVDVKPSELPGFLQVFFGLLVFIVGQPDIATLQVEEYGQVFVFLVGEKALNSTYCNLQNRMKREKGTR